jgi:coenzyme F420-dependent glucose-6-phosphate dehydrogenase
MSAKNGAPVGKGTLEEKMCISTDPDGYIDFIKPYVDAGFTHMYFHTAGPDRKEFLQGFGKNVLPRMR